MGLFDPIMKALSGQPVAPTAAASSGQQGRGPSQADVDAQWYKDNPSAKPADPTPEQLIDQIHPAGGK